MTTKRLNIKFLVTLGVGGLIFLVSVYGLHEFQVRRNAVGLLRRADLAREADDLDESARLRMRYLSHRPEDSAQYTETAFDLKKSLFDKVIGRKDFNKRDLDLAVRYIQEAVTRNGKDVELRREAADFWYQLRRYDDAVVNLEQFREEWTETDRMSYINSLRLIGGPMEVQAMDEFKSTLGWNSDTGAFEQEASHPEMLNAYQALVMLLMQRDLDRDSAVKVMNQMVLANEDNAKAYLNRARLIRFVLREQGVQQAYADIQKAYEIAPDDIDVITAMSGMMLETDRAEDAKRLIELGLDKADSIAQKSRLFRLLSEVYITVKDNEGALAVLDRGNREVPRDRDLLWNKARLLLDQKRHKEVEEMYKPLKKAGHDDPMIGYLQARILMDNGDYMKAIKGLRMIRGVMPTNMQYDVDTYLSEGYGRLGRYEKQLEMIRELRNKYPSNQTVNESYMRVLIQLRRTKEAQEFITARIAELKADGQPIPQSYNLAQMTLQMNDADIGANNLTDAQQAELDRKFDQALNDESLPDAQRRTLLLRKLRQNDDPQAAKATLKDAIRESPETFSLWAMLIDFAEGEEEAISFFNSMQKSIDQEKYGAAMTSMKAKIAVKYAPEKAPRVLTAVENEIGGYSDAEQVALLFELGQLNAVLKNRDETNRLFEKALEKNPANSQNSTTLRILNTLFEDAIAQADPDRINEITDRIRQAVGSDDESYRIVEARRIVWNIRNGQTSEEQRAGELRRARELIETIRNANKEWLPGILVESDIQRLDGNPVAAIELLEVAHGYQTSNARIIRAIAQSYRELNQPQKVDEWMQKLPDSLRNDSDNRVVLTTLWAQRASWTPQDQQQVVQLLETIAPATSESIKDQLLRSQIYLHLKQMDKAETAAKRAVEIEPQLADAWTNLVNIYRLQGKNDKAKEVIQEADSELPEAIKPIVLGRCYAILRDFNQAQANFVSALRADPKNATAKRMLAETFIADRKIAPAVKVIQDIIATGDPTRDVLVVFWARRSLAKIYASTKNHEAFLRALELLEQNAIDEELSREDLSLLVSFCYARPEKSSWDRALIRVDQIAKKRRLTDDEIFMKAQLYEKYGDQHWAEVKKMTTGVLSRNSSNKPAVESFIRWLLKRGEVEEAERWSENNLEKTAVMRFRVGLHSDAKRGQYERAARKIQQRIPKKLDVPEAQSQQLTLAAIAEELGQYDSRFYTMAERMLLRLAEKVPSEILRVASVMGAHGDTAKVKKALKMCIEADRNEISNLLSARVAVAVLREHPEDWEGSLASSIREVGSWLDQISAANPDDLLLQWRVAEFYDMTGNLDRVEDKYQAILASPEFKNPTDRGMVMNNLAFAMALNGKTSQPMQLVNEAEKVLGDISDLIDTKGYIYFVQGDTDAAISQFQRAISSGPKSGQKFFHLALAYHKKNNRAKAESNWREALQYGLDRFKLPPALRSQYDKLEAEFGGTPIAQR